MNTTKIETAGDKAMQHAAMLALVSACGRGSLVEVDYVGGRKATAKAVAEAEESAAAGETTLLCRLVGSFFTKKGDFCVRVIATNRVSADGGVCYRTLNTRVGELRSLTVHEVRFDSFQALAA